MRAVLLSAVHIDGMRTAQGLPIIDGMRTAQWLPLIDDMRTAQWSTLTA